MINVIEGTSVQPKVYDSINDLRQLLGRNQFIVLLEADAKRVVRVLGTAKTTYEKVVWVRGNNTTTYTDYIITVE